jgi:hypothetical protein
MKIFDDWFSILHFLLGLLTASLQSPYNLFPPFWFIIYEIYESRTKKEIFYDVLEFFFGIVAYFILKQCMVAFVYEYDNGIFYIM